MHSVAVIVLNYNDSNTVIKFVNRIQCWKTTGYTYHIIIVDNDSSDGSFERLHSMYSNNERFDVITSACNRGYSYGNNFGAKYAIEKYHPDFIAISNPDANFDEKTLGELLATFEFDKHIMAVSPIMKDINGNYSIFCQMLPKYIDDLKLCFHDTSSKTIIKENYPVLPGHENCVITEMIPGSFFVIKTDYYTKIGMLDENTFLYCEERILGKRIKNAGGKEIYRSDLYFTHEHSVSIKKQFNIIQQQKMIYKARLYYQREYNHCGYLLYLILMLCMTLSVVLLTLKLRIYTILKYIIYKVKKSKQ